MPQSAPTSAPSTSELVPVFDGHNDVLLRLLRSDEVDPVAAFLEGRSDGHIDLPRARIGGFAGGLFACWVPSPPYRRGIEDAPTPERAEALDATIAMMAILTRIERASAGAVRICRSAAEIRAAIAADVLAPVLHIEGAEAIDRDLNALAVFHAAGLRSLGPVWSRDNLFGAGVRFRFPSSPDIGPGLTDLGKALVRACDELRIMVDLAHLTEKGFWDVAETSTRPLVASHSNVHALCPQSRNLTDRQLDAIRERNGFVGVNFGAGFLHARGARDLDLPIDVVVRHIEYLAERVGIDGVGLGSDFDGTTVPKVLGDVAALQVIPQALRAAGWSEADVARVCHGNWIRVLEAIWGN